MPPPPTAPDWPPTDLRFPSPAHLVLEEASPAQSPSVPLSEASIAVDSEQHTRVQYTAVEDIAQQSEKFHQGGSYIDQVYPLPP